jgi:hypothetical protein
MNSRDLVLAIMADVQFLAKTDKNTAQNFNFRGIESVVNAVGPSLRKHGGFLTSNIVSSEKSTMTTKNGAVMNVVSATVKFKLYGSEGEPVKGEVFAEGGDTGLMACSKMLSIANRMFMLTLLQLPTGEPDPDSETHELTPQSDGAPSVTELKAKIAGYFSGQPKSAITAALENHTGKKANWSAHELAGYLYTLEGSK